MIKTPTEILREAREAAGFKSAAEAAEHFGWNTATYTSHENGTRKMTRAARRYARAFREQGVTEGALLGLGDANDWDGGERSIYIIGDAAVGLWRDSAFNEGKQPRSGADKKIRLPDGGSGKRFAVRAIDNSANRAVPAGEYAICEPIDADDLADLTVGKFVVIDRSKSSLIERTIRRVKGRTGTKIELQTYSTEKRFNETLTFPSGKAGEQIDIVGLVVGRYADLI